MITAGEILKRKRESLGRSLELVSQETKIQKRFLQYIENNEFSKFDSEVFLTGFIKIYSKYLNLDTEKVLALYRRSKPLKKVSNSTRSGTKIEKHRKFTLSPRTIITIASILFFVLILGYIGLQIYKFQSPPTLSILSPENNSTTDNPQLTVRGATQVGAIVEVNGTLVELDNDGNFQKEITLNEGANIITIKARKNSSSLQETVEARKITYTKPAQTTEVPQETVKTFTLTVEVKDSPSWVKLDIDDQNIVSQVIQPSKKEYPVKSKFYIITGKVNNTNIYINNEQLAWKTNSTTGVAEITCNIVNQALSCE